MIGVPRRYYALDTIKNKSSASAALRSIGMLLEAGEAIESAMSLTAEKTHLSALVREELKLNVEESPDMDGFVRYIKRLRSFYPDPIPQLLMSSIHNKLPAQGILRAADHMDNRLKLQNEHLPTIDYMSKSILILVFILWFCSTVILPSLSRTMDSLKTDAIHPYRMGASFFKFPDFDLKLVYLFIFTMFLWKYLPSLRPGALLGRLYLLIFGHRYPMVKSRLYLNLATGLALAGDAVKSGLSLQDSLRLAASTSSNLKYKAGWNSMANEIAQGQPVLKVVKEAGIIPPDIASLLMSRSITPKCLYSMSEFLELRGTTYAKHVFQLLLTAYYLFIGLIVLLIVSSIYLWQIEVISTLIKMTGIS